MILQILGLDGEGFPARPPLVQELAQQHLILGNEAVNRLSGLGGADSLFGGAGMDALAGGAGNDWLEGGAQRDLLRGDDGADHFVLLLPAASADADRISDFDRMEGDRLVLSGFPLPPGLPVVLLGNLTGRAATAADRLIYETDAGRLWFDADGTGAAAPVLVAALAGAPTLLASDIDLL